MLLLQFNCTMRFQSWVGTAGRAIIGPISASGLDTVASGKLLNFRLCLCLMGKGTIKETRTKMLQTLPPKQINLVLSFIILLWNMEVIPVRQTSSTAQKPYFQRPLTQRGRGRLYLHYIEVLTPRGSSLNRNITLLLVQTCVCSFPSFGGWGVALF